MTKNEMWEGFGDRSLGTEHLVERAEGDVGGRRNRPGAERIDIGGPFGKNREPAYLAINPNGLVPTLEEDDGPSFGNQMPSCAISRPSTARKCSSRPICTRGRRPMPGWIGSCGYWTRHHAVFRGHGPHAA